MLTNTKSSLQRATLCAAIAAAAAFSAPSFAAVHDGTAPRVTINYTDLDLSNDKDAATLYRRLQTASRGVCSSLRGHELAGVQRYKDCYSKALADAVNAVDERTLTALHNRPGATTARNSRYSSAEGA